MLTKFLKNFIKVIQPFFTIGIKRTNDINKAEILTLNQQLKNINHIYHILTSFPDFHKTMIDIVAEKTPLLLAIQHGKHKHAMKVTIYKYLNIICNFICNPELIAKGATWTSRFTFIQEQQNQEQEQEQEQQQEQDNNIINQDSVQQQINQRPVDQNQNEQQNNNQNQDYKNIEDKQQHDGSTFEDQKQYEQYVNSLFSNLQNELNFSIDSDCFAYGNTLDIDFQNILFLEPRNYFDQFLN